MFLMQNNVFDSLKIKKITKITKRQNVCVLREKLKVRTKLQIYFQKKVRIITQVWLVNNGDISENSMIEKKNVVLL